MTTQIAKQKDVGDPNRNRHGLVKRMQRNHRHEQTRLFVHNRLLHSCEGWCVSNIAGEGSSNKPALCNSSDLIQLRPSVCGEPGIARFSFGEDIMGTNPRPDLLHFAVNLRLAYLGVVENLDPSHVLTIGLAG